MGTLSRLIKNIWVKRINFLFAFGLLTGCFAGLTAQVTVNNTFTAQQLIEDKLIGTNSGIEAFNFQFNGMDANLVTIQAGFFQNGGVIGTQSGIILATGDADLAEEANNSDNAGDNVFVFYQDPDLNSIASNTTNDAAVLEFDFIPEGNLLSFNYAFASEEYNEYVNDIYNDVFGFFLTGPDGNTINIAIAANDDVVSINNVNNGSNSSQYNDNDFGDYNGNPPFPNFQYDGFTDLLTATAPVICGDTFHIKLAIADVGDHIFDSAVFLEEGSFGTNFPVTMELDIFSNGDPEILYEECGFGELVFTRIADKDFDTWIYFGFNEGSTATNGVDYTLVPDSLLFPAGDSVTTFPIAGIPDDIIEGLEVAIFNITNTLSFCGLTEINSPPVAFSIQEAPLISMTTFDTIICADETIVLNPQPTNGYGDYNFLWNNGDTTSSIVASESGVYSVTVGDSCGIVSIVDSFMVTIGYPPILVDAGIDDTSHFCNDTLYLNGSISGGNGVYNFYWATEDDTIKNMLSGIAIVDQADFGTYSLVVTDGCNTATLDQVTLFYGDTPFEIDAGINDTAHSCLDTLFLNGDVSGGFGDVTYYWVSGTDTIFDILDGISQTNLSEDLPYSFIAQDECESIIEDQVLLKYDPTPLIVDAGGDNNTLSCKTPLTLLGNIVEPGAGDFESTEWIDLNLDSVIYDQGLFYQTLISETTIIVLKVVDVCGLVGTDTITLSYDPPPLILDAGPDLTAVHCQDTLTLSALVEGGTGGNIFTWINNGDTLSTDSTFSVNITEFQLYELYVTDQCDQEELDFVLLNFEPEPINPTILQEGGICFGNELVYTSEPSGGAAPYTYKWNDEPPGTNNQLIFIVDSSAFFNLEITDICGTKADTSVTFEVEHITAKGAFNYTDVASVIQLINDSDPPGLEYLWDFGDNTSSTEFEPTHEYLDSEDHVITLTVTTDRGCEETFELIYKTTSKIYIPNAFTPDGNGTNDYISIQGDNIKTVKMQIFDRWGKQVYELNSTEDKWYGDHQKKGDDLTSSVYNYVVEWTDNRNSSFRKTGSILMLK